MRILVTGSRGMLGRTLLRRLAGQELIAADLPEWDVTDDTGLLAKVCEAAPDVVIHCAAMTDADACEADRDRAFKVNEEGFRNVALACKTSGARLIALSTDLVFGGEPPRVPWAWGEMDIPRPRTVCGASVFAGEQMIQMILPDAVILRTGWLYGAGGPSFVHETVRQGAGAGGPIRAADDRRGNPTSCDVVADAIRFLLGKPDVSGIVHATCEEQCSPYEFAREIARLVPGFAREIVPCAAAELPGRAPLPANTALKKSVLNLLGYRTPPWPAALAEFVKAEFGGKTA